MEISQLKRREIHTFQYSTLRKKKSNIGRYYKWKIVLKVKNYPNSIINGREQQRQLSFNAKNKLLAFMPHQKDTFLRNSLEGTQKVIASPVQCNVVM